jgi:hypothetical protein
MTHQLEVTFNFSQPPRDTCEYQLLNCVPTLKEHTENIFLLKTYENMKVYFLLFLHYNQSCVEALRWTDLASAVYLTGFISIIVITFWNIIFKRHSLLGQFK